MSNTFFSLDGDSICEERRNIKDGKTAQTILQNQPEYDNILQIRKAKGDCFVAANRERKGARMKKRLLSLVLAVVMALSLAVVSAGASAGSAWDIDVNDIPEREQLVSFLESLEFYLEFGDWDDKYVDGEYYHDHRYDCRTITAVGDGGLFETLVRSYEFEPDGQNIYPGERGVDLWGTGDTHADTYSHRSDKTRIDWIMRNVFNCSEEDLETLKDRAFNQTGWNDHPAVIETDSYYYGQSLDIGWEEGWPTSDFLSAKYDGTYYYIEYRPHSLWEDFWDEYEYGRITGENYSTYYATLALKEIDGKQYWSIYANSPTGFISVDDSAAEPTPAPAPQDDIKSIDISDLPEREQLDRFLRFVLGQVTTQNSTNAWNLNDYYNYDCRSIAPRKYGGIFNTLVYRHCEIEPEGQSIFPGERQVSIWNTGVPYSDAYTYRSDKTRVDWVMQNVLNCSTEDLEVLKSYAFQEIGWRGQPAIIEIDGYYYGDEPSESWGESYWDDINYVSAKTDGFYYYIQYIPHLIEDIWLDPCYATLALKEINGNHYWSVYANSSSGFVYFDPPASTPEQPSTGFTDVAETAWYAGDVADIQKYGLINGHPDGTFRPQEKLTLAQAITLAARTHAQLNDKGDIQNGSPWYQPYVDYAAENGLCFVGEFGTDYNGECSRLTMAVLFQRAFPTDTEQVLNNVTILPDVEDEGYGSSVFYLYRQGVLTGNDEVGTFKPDKSISRAEAAAILNRVMDTEKRKSFQLKENDTQATSPAEGNENTQTETRIFIKNTSGTLNLRSLPQHKSDLAGTVSDQSYLYFHGEVGQGLGSDGKNHDWYKVTTENGTVGWARSDLLKELH